MDYFRLNNGSEIPALCFGPGIMVRGLKPNKTVIGKIKNRIKLRYVEKAYYNAILQGIKAGIRFIDYSASYGREDLISKAIKECGVDRKEFVLTTRISNQAQFCNNVRDSFFKSLEKYETDYIDILMFHWPVTGFYEKTWLEMIKLQQEGFCKILGVANCHEHHIEHLFEESNVIPSINQVEIHPLLTQKKLLGYCKERHIQVEAYTPIARFDERLVRLPLLQKMSERYNKSIAQLILRWHIQNGVIPVFRSLNQYRLRENTSIFDFVLSDEDMKAIDAINIDSRLRYNPDNCDFTIL